MLCPPPFPAADDYDNLLSDADAAFMLVDPRVARSYATRAADVVRDVAADVAARLQAGRSAAADLEAELQGRLEALLMRRAFAARGDDDDELAATQRQQADAEAEAVASAAAVSDDGVAFDVAVGLPVRLASANAVPQTTESARAAGLAAAVEAQQAARLAQRARREVKEAGPAKKLSLDITIDADNPGEMGATAEGVDRRAGGSRFVPQRSEGCGAAARRLCRRGAQLCSSAALGASGARLPPDLPAPWALCRGGAAHGRQPGRAFEDVAGGRHCPQPG